MKLLVLNGPNLNMLGIREKQLYGNTTYEELCNYIQDYCLHNDIRVMIQQSNNEGDLVTWIQKAYQKVDGIIINAGAYTHTSIAILDALKAVQIPCVEVHITDIQQREEFRKTNYIQYACEKSFIGLGIEGYIAAIQYFQKKSDQS